MSAAGHLWKGAGANGYIFWSDSVCNYALRCDNSCYLHCTQKIAPSLWQSKALLFVVCYLPAARCSLAIGSLVKHIIYHGSTFYNHNFWKTARCYQHRTALDISRRIHRPDKPTMIVSSPGTACKRFFAGCCFCTQIPKKRSHWTHRWEVWELLLVKSYHNQEDDTMAKAKYTRQKNGRKPSGMP